MWLLVLGLAAASAAYLYFWITRHHGMFAKHGILEPPKRFPFGSEPSWQIMTGKLSFFNALQPTYRKYSANHKVLGLFALHKPFLLINDVDLAKAVLVKDFDHFEARRPAVVDPTSALANVVVSNFMINLHGDKWRKVRSTLTPAFTSGKLKSMGPQIWKAGVELTTFLDEEYADRDVEFNMKRVMTSFTTEVMASCGFGIRANSFRDPDGTFKRHLDRLFGGTQDTPTLPLKFIFALVAPWLMKLLKMTVFDEDSIRFLSDVVRDCQRQRREAKGNKKSGNLVDLLMDALEKDGISSQQQEHESQFERDAAIEGGSYKISHDDIEMVLISNVIGLFFAGFETTSTAVTMSMGFLAKHQDVQQKLHEEVVEAFEKHGTRDLDFPSVQELPYLDKFFNEELRFYSSGTLERECTRDYPLPDSTFVIPKGMMVQVPSNAIQRDPKFYPDPHNFNPDANWSAEARADRIPYSFMAFGQGPRNCIGMRFAVLVVKMCVVRMVGDYRIKEGPSMPKEFVPSPLHVFGLCRGSVWCKLEKRNKAK